MSYYGLQKDDVVTIFTTSGNSYISNCVTNEIEKFCNWSMVIEPKTKILFVNHEFGYPYENLMELKKYNLPVIEDCAHSFFSIDKKNSIGNMGDFVIYSFPKMFPLQIGGLVVSKIPFALEKAKKVTRDELAYIKNVLSKNIRNKDKIIQDRILNYKFLQERFSSLGLSERFQLSEGVVPGVFMFRADEMKISLPELKNYYYAHGIQCSVFYGENAFFIPVHQALNDRDLDYFYEVIISFLNLY